MLHFSVSAIPLQVTRPLIVIAGSTQHSSFFFQPSPPFDHHGSSCCISIQLMLETMMSMLNKLVNSSTRRGLDAPASASLPGGSPSRKDSEEHEPALAPAAQTADPANDNEQVRTRETSSASLQTMPMTNTRSATLHRRIRKARTAATVLVSHLGPSPRMIPR